MVGVAAVVAATTVVAVTTGTWTCVDKVVAGVQESNKRVTDRSELKSKRYGEKVIATLYVRR